MKEKVIKLMAANVHCVLSTAGHGSQPESALVGFSEDASLGLLIGTGKDTRKCKNIETNPRISVVIADEKQKLEIQYEGTAKIHKAEEIRDRLETHFKKLPAARRRLEDPNQVWIVVQPSWIRYVDASSGMDFEEMRQFS